MFTFLILVMVKKPIFYMFDMDDTLVKRLSQEDYDKDRSESFLTLNYVVDKPKMINLFNQLKTQTSHVGIMTARHPLVKNEIKKRFKTENVWTRGIYLDYDEVSEKVRDEEFVDHEFITNTISEKIDVLNKLAEIYIIIMWDDKANDFMQFKDKLHKDVYIFEPMWY